MILSIHFTDAEIRNYLVAKGFALVKHTFGRWRPAYHNSQEWHEYEADAVVIDGKPIEASGLFENIITASLKQLLNND